MCKRWEQKCLHIIDKTSEVLVKDYQRRLSDYYEYRKHHAEWEDKLEQHKKRLLDHTRYILYELLRTKEKKMVKISFPEFSNQETENQFQIFWSFELVANNVTRRFVTEIELKYANVARFKKISERFGVNLEKKFS